jgi:hypothetical protein
LIRYFAFEFDSAETTPSTSTSLSLTQQQEKAAGDNFKSFFSTAFSGGDISVMTAKHSEILESLGGSSQMVAPYFNAISSLLPNLTSTPTDEEKSQIINGVNQVLINGLNLVKSQPGLENVDTDKRLFALPELAEFFRALQNLLVEVEKMRSDPSYAVVYFKNPQLPDYLARFAVLVVEASKVARTLPALTSMHFVS